MQDQDDRLKIENVQSLYPDDLSDDWNTGIDVCKKIRDGGIKGKQITIKGISQVFIIKPYN